MWQHPAATQRQTRHPLLQQRRVFRGMGAADTHQQPRQLDRLSVHQFMQRFFTYPLDSNEFRGTVVDMTEMTYEQYAAIMANKPSVQPYTASQWAKMGSQQKMLLALTYRRELATL